MVSVFSVHIWRDGFPLSGVVLELLRVLGMLVLGPRGHDHEPGLGEHVAAERPSHPGKAKPTQGLEIS